MNSGPAPPKRENSFGGNSSYQGGRGGGSMDSSNRVYVGNLAWSVDQQQLETLFSEQGKVVDAKVVYDRDSGRSRGFGFVTYSSAQEVNDAIESLDGVVSHSYSATLCIFLYVLYVHVSVFTSWSHFPSRGWFCTGLTLWVSIL